MRGKRVTVMGLGRHGGGVAAARWLAEQGCRVTVTDLQPAESLVESLAALEDVPIERFALGGHDEVDFRKAHIVVVNPAVKPRHPLIKLARQRRAKITSEIELFLEWCPATVVGVTGTTGKSTTCTMLAEMLRHSGKCTWLGGNIGHSLLAELHWMHENDVVVLELSSFQLAHLSCNAKLPEMAIITNCTPNHLDWHESWTAYVWSKQRLLAAQFPHHVAVLNTCDPEVNTWRKLAVGKVVPLVDDSFVPDLPIPGPHNRQNARLAATAATFLGVDKRAIDAALGCFVGLPHRLEFVAEVAGRRFFNDSKATSPLATIAALNAIDGPVWLLAGGVDRGDEWRVLAAHIASTTRGAAFFGQARINLAKSVQGVSSAVDEALDLSSRNTSKSARGGAAVKWIAVEHLADALAWAFEKSRPGDSILLSPACPSFDQFADYAERGRLFVELVHALSDTHVSQESETTPQQ